MNDRSGLTHTGVKKFQGKEKVAECVKSVGHENRKHQVSDSQLMIKQTTFFSSNVSTGKSCLTKTRAILVETLELKKSSAHVIHEGESGLARN